DDPDGPPRARPAGPDPVSLGSHGQSRRAERRPAAPRFVSRRLELHDPSHAFGKAIGSGPLISQRALSEPPILIAEAESLGIVASAVDVDVVAFERCVLTGTPDALAEAARLYRGDFLEGFRIAEAPF